MIRTQVQLSERHYEILRRRSLQTRKSMAQQIREALNLYLRSEEMADDDLSDIAGRFKALPMQELKAHDRQFVEAILESKKGDEVKG